jgi:hypothetical protein
MLAAGAAVALLTGTAGAAAAATTGSASPSAASSSAPAPKPSPTGTDNGGGKPGNQPEWLAQLAASLHVNVQKLETALIDAKQTIGRLGVAPNDPAVVAVVTHDLGISADQAKHLLTEVFGDVAPGKDGSGYGGSGKGGPGKPGTGKTPPPPGTPDPKLSQTLAGILHVSDARAAQVLEQLDRIARPSRSVSIDDPQFRALAASLHLTPQQLDDALHQMKEDLRASMPSPSDSSSAQAKAPSPGSS